MQSRVLAVVAVILPLAVPGAVRAEAIAVEWQGRVLRVDPGAAEPIGQEVGLTGMLGLNALAGRQSGELVVARTRGLGADTVGFFVIDEETGAAEVAHLVQFLPDPSRLSNANVTAAAFAPGGDLYFTNVIPSLGGDPRPRISELWLLDWETGLAEPIGSTLLGGIGGLAFDAAGNLYGFDLGTGNGMGFGLVAIDLETGAATDLDPAVPGNAFEVQSIAFDAKSQLWGARRDLHRLDPGSGAILSSQNITALADVRGLEFPTRVGLDIKPRNRKNPVKPTSRGYLRVAILGSALFPVSEIDVASLAFGPDGAPALHSRDAHYKDVDRDGATDLVTRFRISASGIGADTRQACVRGETFAGLAFEGCDFVRIVGKRRK